MSSSTSQDPFVKFSSQKYDKLKASCLSKNNLFVDELFPANDTSLFRKKRINGVKWKRPHEICSSPKFVIGGISARDVNQGQLGNCWFVAALSVLTSEKKFLNKVIPDLNEQEMNEKTYAGIFKFCFWQLGKWIEIVIDDLLPTINDRLIYTRSSTGNEYWSCLLEKAYAK
jgi:calpain-5